MIHRLGVVNCKWKFGENEVNAKLFLQVIKGVNGFVNRIEWTELDQTNNPRFDTAMKKIELEIILKKKKNQISIQ